MGKYIVRYGTMRSLGVMTARTDDYRRGMEVVIRSERGVEVGQVLCESTEDELSHLDQPPVGTIVRAVGDDDAVAIDAIESTRLKEISGCQKHVDSLGLDMKLIEVERLLGGQRMIVYFVSKERIDFRELVKLLATEFQTRIEMKQVGVRDEAKILADYGDCGKPVCCNNHLVKMPPVSMKMAKLQKATLDPTKISGRCGRLKCCLRYEFDTYEEIQKQLPPIGAMVVTREGKGKVLNHQILAEQLLIETEDNRRMLIEASEVLTVIKKAVGKKAVGKKAVGKKSGRGSSKGEVPEIDARPKPEKVAGESAREKKSNRSESAAVQNKTPTAFSQQKKPTASSQQKNTSAASKAARKSNRKRPPRGNRPQQDSAPQESEGPKDVNGRNTEVSSPDKSKRAGKRRRSRRPRKDQ